MPVSTGDIHLSYSFKASADARPGYALLPGIDLELLGAPGLTGSSGHPSCARRQTRGRVEVLLDGSPIMLKALDAESRVAGIRCRAGSPVMDALLCVHHHLMVPYSQTYRFVDLTVLMDLCTISVCIPKTVGRDPWVS